MNIRNRLPDIEILLTRILQGYFRLEISRLSMADTWKTNLYSEILNGLQSNAASSYRGAYDVIQVKGLESYDIEDMDITILCAILGNSRSFTGFQPTQIYPWIHILRGNRNLKDHSSGNEPDHLMLEFAYAALHDARRFLEAVRKHGKSSTSSTQSFADTFIPQIDEMARLLSDDMEQSLYDNSRWMQFQNDIQLVKQSKVPADFWHQLMLNKYRSETYYADGTYREFLIIATRAGILFARHELADGYFEGYSFCGIPRDFSKALEHYHWLQEHGELNPNERINLASLYVNGLDPAHSKDDGAQILSSINQERCYLTDYKVDEYTFYRLCFHKKGLLS